MGVEEADCFHIAFFRGLDGTLFVHVRSIAFFKVISPFSFTENSVIPCRFQ
jgi:hypothetical protein